MSFVTLQRTATLVVDGKLHAISELDLGVLKHTYEANDKVLVCKWLRANFGLSLAESKSAMECLANEFKWASYEACHWCGAMVSPVGCCSNCGGN